MEDKLNKYFSTLRHFSNAFMNRIANNGRGIEFNLKLSQLKAIAAFKDDLAHSMNVLADNAMVKLPNMTTMVDSLTKDGIAVREKSETDRRKVLVRLTPKGKKIRAQFIANRRKAAVSIFSSLSENDKNELLNSLDKVCKILERSLSESAAQHDKKNKSIPLPKK
jgi:DNA-binding MarR family transcriptional regulator